jgi:hypothetical protein
VTGNRREIFALATNGVFRGAGTAFRKMPFDATACQALAANETSLFCVREGRDPVKSVPR